MAAVESDTKDLVKVSVGDATAASKAAFRGFDSQNYICEEDWLTIFQVDKVKISLHKVSRTPEDKLIKPLRTNKYQ